jgi:hypothetical protein
MTGWSGIAGTHHFLVPEEDAARALVHALAAQGFALVAARPDQLDGGWVVTAFDEGPYPVDRSGHRAMDAVGSVAAAVARRHGGRPDGGSRYDVAVLTQLSEIASHAPIVAANPGARPTVPDAVAAVAAPPRTRLALAPGPGLLPGDPLEGVDDVDWGRLAHAHGRADDIPALLRALVDPGGDWDAVVQELIADDVLHQGTCYAATAPAMRFVARVVAAGALPPAGRVHVATLLVWAASGWATSLVLDAERAAAEGRPPRPAPHTGDVRDALAEEVPRLLARWTAEPPAMRYVLAALTTLTAPAALDAGAVAELAAEYAGTQQAAYLELAIALLAGDQPAVLAAATAIAPWAEDVGPGWEAVPAPLEVKAAEILALGVLETSVAVEPR